MQQERNYVDIRHLNRKRENPKYQKVRDYVKERVED